VVRRLLNIFLWNKIGLVINPIEFPRELGWTHASFPTILPSNREEEIIIYFNVRDKFNQSHIVNCIFNFEKMNLTFLSLNSLFGPGKLGAFDDSGVTLGSICSVDGKNILFYTGWNLTRKVIVNNSIGLAYLSGSTGIFERIFDGPIMTRNQYEPYSCASPFVIWDPNHSKFLMWYASMDRWIGDEINSKHFYDLKLAYSFDGVTWTRPAISAITYDTEEEYAFGRPFIRKISNEFEMFFSVRGNSYQIERAISSDGIKWERMGPIKWKGKEKNWDVEMQTYPSIFNYKGTDFMFYNGNGYGKTGIGIAINE